MKASQPLTSVPCASTAVWRPTDQIALPASGRLCHVPVKPLNVCNWPASATSHSESLLLAGPFNTVAWADTGTDSNVPRWVENAMQTPGSVTSSRSLASRNVAFGPTICVRQSRVTAEKTCRLLPSR